MEPTDRPTFKIAEVAHMVGVSSSTLRLWESQGLVTPQRTPSGHRQYLECHVQQVKRVAFYRVEQGLNPAAIRVALAEDGLSRPMPASSSKPPSSIGRKLRALRRAAGLTLDQVASDTGVSASVLSTLERTSQGGSFRILHELAMYYGTTVSELSGDTKGPRSLVRAGTWHNWPETTPGVTVHLLAEGKHSMDCHRFTLAAGASSVGAYSHEGEEFLHVLSGSLEITLDGNECHILGQNDSLYFESRRPHEWRNSHDGETILFWINTPQSF